ncbi:hypothetical protein [Clostridium tertium]|uniref:hypothetical protein n=1 Tax=Clostridium tertium TaxID=1559 RepID=UPI000BE3C54B|nr:hypothetical protein [Clostridium tertium]
MGIYKIGKCDYCDNKGEIVRPTPFMADIAMMCEYCWNETKKEYAASHGEYIDDFQSNQEEYKKLDEIQKNIFYEEELRRLEEEFRRCGYSDEVIEEIKRIEGATTLEEFVANLEEELSSWSE